MIEKAQDIRVVRADERLVEFPWPALESIDVPALGASDCLVVCGGFEDRATEVLRRVCHGRREQLQVGLINYLPENDENRAGEMREVAARGGAMVTELIYDRRDPGTVGQPVQRFLAKFERVVVDVSGMSRLLIVQMVVTLLRILGKRLTVVYTEAERYLPSEDEFASMRAEDRGEGRGGILIIGDFRNRGYVGVEFYSDVGRTRQVGGVSIL